MATRREGSAPRHQFGKPISHPSFQSHAAATGYRRCETNLSPRDMSSSIRLRKEACGSASTLWDSRDADFVRNILQQQSWLGDANFGGQQDHAAVPAFILMSVVAGGMFATPPLANPFPGHTLFTP
jgi:hypothetical protein